MKVLHIIPSLDPVYGGPSYSVPRLALAQFQLGLSVDIASVGYSGNYGDVNQYAFPHSFSNIRVLRSLRCSPGLRDFLRAEVRKYDLVHSHGCWLMPNVYAGRFAQSSGTPLVVSPRGMFSLEALSVSRIRKRVFWSLVQQRAYADAAVWHATSLAEASDIRSFVGSASAVRVVPNGMDIPNVRATHALNSDQRVLLFLSRIHPKKGLEELLIAWERISQRIPHWSLKIVGPSERGYRRTLERHVVARQISRVSFGDAVHGKDKDRAYQNADVFILPTRSENFGLVVAEALAYELPAIVCRGAPWEGLQMNRCGWWIECDPNRIAAAILEATIMTATERSNMGRRGRAWIAREFGWSSAAHELRDVYYNIIKLRASKGLQG